MGKKLHFNAYLLKAKMFASIYLLDGKSNKIRKFYFANFANLGNI